MIKDGFLESNTGLPYYECCNEESLSLLLLVV